MKRLMFCGLALMLSVSVTAGAEGRTLRSLLAPALFGQGASVPSPSLSPIPDPAGSVAVPQPYDPSAPMGTPVVGTPMVGTPMISSPLVLFSDVRYRAERNIAPCAVPMIIQVPDPCNKSNCCNNCVNVQVCVPPCDPQCVKVTKCGERVCYDFGKYSVVARVVGDHIVVRYYD